MGIEESKLFKIFEDSIKFTTKILGHTNEALFPIQAKDFIHGKGFVKNQLRGGVDLFVLAPLFPFLAVAGTVTKLGELSIKALSKVHSNNKTENEKENESDLIINLLSKYTKDCLIDLVRVMKFESIKNITRLEAERRLLIHFLSLNNIEYSIEFLTNFKKEYEKEIRKRLGTVNKKKKETEKKKEFLLNNLHLTNREQEEALKTPYHQLHKIKKENNIPLYSEVKDEIEKASAITYKDSEEFKKKISIMKSLNINIPKRNFYKFATDSDVSDLNHKLIKSINHKLIKRSGKLNISQFDKYTDLLLGHKLYKSDIKPIDESLQKHYELALKEAKEKKDKERIRKANEREKARKEVNKLKTKQDQNNLPKNHNKKWSKSDDLKLLEMINLKKSIEEITDYFLRTENSIILRYITVHKVRYKKLEYLLDDELKSKIQSYYKKHHKDLLPPSLKA